MNAREAEEHLVEALRAAGCQPDENSWTHTWEIAGPHAWKALDVFIEQAHIEVAPSPWDPGEDGIEYDDGELPLTLRSHAQGDMLMYDASLQQDDPFMPKGLEPHVELGFTRQFAWSGDGGYIEGLRLAIELPVFEIDGGLDQGERFCGGPPLAGEELERWRAWYPEDWFAGFAGGAPAWWADVHARRSFQDARLKAPLKATVNYDEIG